MDAKEAIIYSRASSAGIRSAPAAILAASTPRPSPHAPLEHQEFLTLTRPGRRGPPSLPTRPSGGLVRARERGGAPPARNGRREWCVSAGGVVSGGGVSEGR